MSVEHRGPGLGLEKSVGNFALTVRISRTDDTGGTLMGQYTDRGFTGHEHLEEAQLIHMKTHGVRSSIQKTHGVRSSIDVGLDKYLGNIAASDLYATQL